MSNRSRRSSSRCHAAALAGLPGRRQRLADRPRRKCVRAVVEPKIDNPRVAAQTPCSDDVRSQVQAVLGLDSVPTPESAWADSRYTCTYQTPQGPLVYAVTVESSRAAAADYFETLRRELRANSSLTGLDKAYQNGLGAVVALVDSLVLSVDVSALQADTSARTIRQRPGWRSSWPAAWSSARQARTEPPARPWYAR